MTLIDNLHNLGTLLKTNLETKGITGLTGNEGLTTLANKILDIEGNGSECNCNRIVLTSEAVDDGVSQENIVSYNFTATLNILNESNVNKSIVLELYESDSEEPFSELIASTSNNGEATFSYQCQNKGELEVVAKYNDISSNIITITDNVIIKLNTRFNYSSSNIIIKEGQTANITGTLLDENDNYLSDKQIILENINSSNHSTFRTNNIGQYNIPVTLTDAGNYEYRVIFNGDTYYNSSSTNTITVTVKEVYSSSLNIYTNNSTVISGEIINIGGKLTCDDINNANVKVYRNNVLLNTITVNSDGTFNTSDTIMDGGDYVYKVVYEGDEYHTNSESNTVNVHVADYLLTVAPTKRIVSNGEVNKIQATLTDNGNPVENVEISLNIEGNIVGITTGSNGVAEYNYTGTGNKGKIYILATIKNRNVVMGQTFFYDGVDNYVTANVSGDTVKIGDVVNEGWLQSSEPVEIDWGDGTTNRVNNPTSSLTHNYTDNLTTHTVIFGGEVTSLGKYCFYDCTGLTSITIPNSVTSLGMTCFEYCTGLTSITIPSSVTSFGESCFHSCTGLTSITIPSSVTSFGDSCFSSCTGLTSITIPNSVTTIGNYCFSACDGLTSIIIPDSVTTIGSYCFYGCTSLIDYELYWDSNPVAYDSGKMPVNINTVFNIPYGTTSVYTSAGYPSDRLVEREPHNYDLVLSSTTPIIQTGDNAIINAVLTDDNVAVSGKTLNYVVKHGNTTIDSGTGTTDNNGQITISYTGTGVGDVDIVVEYGTLLQETFVVEDCFKYDTTVHTRTTDSTTDTLIPVYNDYSLVSDSFSLEFTFQASEQVGGVGIAPKGRTTPYHHILIGLGANQLSLYIGNQNGGETPYRYESAQYNTDYTCKIEYYDGTVKLYVNNVLMDTITGKSYLNGETRDLYFLEWGVNETIKVKDIKIKTLNPINLTSTSNIISYNDNESTTITATINHPFSNNQAITFTAIDKNENVIDTYTTTTDNNGIATYEYESRGIGDVTIEAKCMSLQETFVVEDCLKYYPLTDNTHESAFTIPSGVVSSYSSDGWNMSATDYSMVRLTDKLTNDCSVEFTLVDYNKLLNYDSVLVYQYSNGETMPNQEIITSGDRDNFPLILGQRMNHNLIKGAKYKIEYTSSTIKVYENNILLASASNTVGFPTRFEWHMGSGGRYAVYKDLKVKAL